MPLTPRGRPALRYPTLSPTQGPTSLGLEPAPSSARINNLFQEFMRTYIIEVKDQAPVALNVEAGKEVLDKSLKPRNPDLYYNYLHMECYYFY